MSDRDNGAPVAGAATPGDRIRALRRQRRWSVREMAARLEVSAATVSAIENGRTAVTVDRLLQVAGVFSVEPAELIQGGATREPAAEPEVSLSPAPPPADGADWRRFPRLDIDPVLLSAIKCFVETGYHGANMRTIAAGAGMSVAGIYHHYENKQRLLVKILDLTMDELDWRLPAARDSAESMKGEPTDRELTNREPTDRRPADRLAALVEALALFHTLRADLAFIGATEMRSVESPDRARIAQRRSAIQRLLDVEIEAAVASGLARTARAREDGRAISTMCTSLPQWFDNAGPTSPQEIAREYAALALRMVGID
ncbi:TetR family transcriptional regulator [Amycolatopsis rhabdoformis]|uniref:TetR family transcriptional regulator n=1 Tax=Amycolatopsis rhabdoformis TaxID=1448059 RepID=A0ABZ1ILK3_9PSEU|nr:TetR family transcriptional regulator [Amycolatopsis rhabdoformis]WSE34751.1 TetR family transcriptional regulator [Amycolatopsis rhabdoformis]